MTEYLKCVLGYKDKANSKIVDSFGDDTRKYLINQPVMQQFLDNLNISERREAYLKTVVKNCTIKISYPNSCQTQIVAETMIAAIESFFSTIDELEFYALTPQININVVFVNQCDSDVIPQERYSDYQFRICKETLNDEVLWKSFATLLAYMTGRNLVSKIDMMQYVRTKQEAEGIMDRITVLMRTKQAVNGVLGDSFKYSIEDWKKDDDFIYTFKGKDNHKSSITYGSVKQETMEISSISSDMSLWDNAGWKGCGFIFDKTKSTPPLMGLAFENIEYGKQIVAEWQEKSESNCNDVLIYMIKGIDKNHPSWYRVCIAPKIKPSETTKMSVACRMHDMTPDNSHNLTAFQIEYEKFGGCWFMALDMKDMNIVMPNSFDKAFKFTDIVIKNAWEISTRDVEKMAIRPDDVPFIPLGQEETAPIIDVLNEFKDFNIL